MKVNFGVVKKYLKYRGFGFVEPILIDNNSKEIFFHIKIIRKKHPELADRLENEESIENIFFWYEVEDSEKGSQIKTILESKDIQKEYVIELPIFIEEVEQRWKNIDFKIPSWLNKITIDLLGSSRTQELIIARNNLELNRKKENKKLIEEQKTQEEIEYSEFKELIAEIASLGFTRSKEVSYYIMRNQLGYKYKNISGIVQMEKDGNTWDFKGGFPPNIYAQICSELNLKNEGSYAKVVNFNSFKKLGK